MGAKGGVLLDPLEDIGRVERLSKDTGWINALVDKGVQHVTGILLLSIDALKWHGNLSGRSFEFGSEVAVAWVRVDEVDIGV